MQAYYGYDLRDLLWGPNQTSVRRLGNLIKGLPTGSALHRALDPDGWQWTTHDELLAVIAELVDHGNRLFHQAHSKPGTQAPRPISIKRPTHGPKPLPAQRRQATAADLEEIFGPEMVKREGGEQ